MVEEDNSFPPLEIFFQNPACYPSNKSSALLGIQNYRLKTRVQGKYIFRCFSSDLRHLILRQIYRMFREDEAGNQDLQPV